MNYLEHVNVTVGKPDEIAQRLINLFDWSIRWRGVAKNDGHTIHVGTKDHYIALYTHNDIMDVGSNSLTISHLNHFAVVVDNLETVSDRAIKLGLKPFNAGEYNPGGKCFYLMIDTEIEIEVVCYDK